MTRGQKTGVAPTRVRRRSVLAAAGACFTMLGQKALAIWEPWAAGMASIATMSKATFSKDREADGMVELVRIHHGKGNGNVKLFWFENAPWPAHFMIYDFPPGASEGVHVHFLDNRNGEGSFDEYYYIISGQGEMEIDGEIVAVAKGDHVHTPLEVAHGIENTHPTEHLRVFLTFIQRGEDPPPFLDPPASRSTG